LTPNLFNPYRFVSGGVLLFDENYEDSSPFTFFNTYFTVNSGGNGLLLGTNVADNVNSQAYRSMPASLPSTFTLKVEYKPTSATNNIYPFCVSYNSTFVNSQTRGIGIKQDSASNMCLFSVASGSFTQSSYNTSLVKDTQYYIKIVNDDTNVSLDIFTGSDYETGQVGSTVSITDPNYTDLITLQHCGRADGGGGTTSFEINNFASYEP